MVLSPPSMASAGWTLSPCTLEGQRQFRMEGSRRLLQGGPSRPGWGFSSLCDTAITLSSRMPCSPRETPLYVSVGRSGVQAVLWKWKVVQSLWAIVCPFLIKLSVNLGSPGGSDGKESACNAGDQGLIPGSGRSPGEGNGYPLQYSCLENSMHRRAWGTTVHGVAKS